MANPKLQLADVSRHIRPHSLSDRITAGPSNRQQRTSATLTKPMSALFLQEIGSARTGDQYADTLLSNTLSAIV